MQILILQGNFSVIGIQLQSYLMALLPLVVEISIAVWSCCRSRCVRRWNVLLRLAGGREYKWNLPSIIHVVNWSTSPFLQLRNPCPITYYSPQMWFLSPTVENNTILNTMADIKRPIFSRYIEKPALTGCSNRYRLCETLQASPENIAKLPTLNLKNLGQWLGLPWH